MRDLGAEIVRLVRWPPSLLVAASLAALVGLTYLDTGLTSSRLPASERRGLGTILEFPGAYEELLAVLLLFGGVLVALYAGALGRAEAGHWPPELGAIGHGHRTATVRTFVALSMVLLLGVALVYGVGMLMGLSAAAVAGRALDEAIDPAALGELPALLVRAWWGFVMLAAIAFGAGLVTARRAAGLAVVGTILLAEQLASLTTPPVLLSWAPITNASLLVTGDTAGEIANALAISCVYVVGSLVLAISLAERATKRSILPHEKPSATGR